MSTLSTAARNAACDAVNALLDGGGYIEFQDVSNAEIAKLPFSATAFGAAVAGVATANAITSDVTTQAGTITQAFYKSVADAVIVTVTVGLVGSGADIELTGLTYALNEELKINSATRTQPA